MSISEEVKQKIEQALPGSHVEIIDQSQMHMLHQESGGAAHLKVIIGYKGFEGKTMLEQHQMIYELLKEELKEKIHALQLETKVN